jgi:hypothetical protein
VARQRLVLSTRLTDSSPLNCMQFSSAWQRMPLLRVKEQACRLLEDAFA